MKVEMTAMLSGAAVHLPGDVVDFPDDEALRLIAAGFAVPATPTIERAVKRPARETRANR